MRAPVGRSVIGGESEYSGSAPRARDTRYGARAQNLDSGRVAPESGGLSMRTWQDALAWMLPTSLLALAIVSVPLLVLDEQGLPRYRALRDERGEVERANEALRHEVRSLARDVEALRTDPASLERIARDELGMVRPREILFQFPE